MSATSLKDLYTQKLRLILDAESSGLQAMSELSANVQSPDLRAGLDRHAEETREQVRRLEQLFRDRGREAHPLECRSARAIVEEARQILPGIEDAATRDAFIIASVQALEHHEIAAYGTARTWALELGMTDEARALQRTLEEEKRADQTLTMLAEGLVNASAANDREIGLASGGRADRASGSASSLGASRGSERGSSETELR